MLVRTSICALILTMALAPQVMAQSAIARQHYMHQGVVLTPTVDIGRGRVDFQTPAQQARVERLMPQIEKAIAIKLANPKTAEFRGIRTGRYQKVMVVCGVVDSIAASGETEKRRFIARPGAASLETSENADAFRAGWKSTGCGF
ncbi:hypothetical protein [Caulobacter vibrioides]|uniref:Uncharacterized protein n=1 Tax=Caulobacter vibrioides (strain NA1000 / CB15N) TaxID=565050 RepID=A0A0H3IZJ1_CAUVN|nr:hypothetical protein [Caulobacter vibrioides]YP_009020538.1 hypothetical protein CCNA_03966 [Caulobacter vibrioides NA1000]AHI88569.1 hypothetical protein CCNA_03966 [Caulobacter vibrioides NA1000]QXZ50618.1 hypothetical protein KZH45_11945 [Caulobacter vibrioides]